MQKLFEKGELVGAETKNPSILMQTAWFYISLFFGKRGRENKSLMKKSMLRLTVTAAGEGYFELNKDEPRAVLSTKNHTGGLDVKITPTAKYLLAPTRHDACFRPLIKSVPLSS